MGKQYRAQALLSIVPAATFASKEGFFITAALAVVASVTAMPYALIVDVQGDTIAASVAVCAGGSPGTWPVKLSAAPGTVARGTKLMLTANGTCKAWDNSSGAMIVAEAQEAGLADELIEAVLLRPYYSSPPTFVSTTGMTLTALMTGGTVSNRGASAAAAFILPPAVPGLEFTGIVETAQELRFDPDGTETIALPSTGVQSAAGKYITANVVSAKVRLVCMTAGTWTVAHYSGTWTAEA